MFVNKPPSILYRPDIDGLRAFAVVSVLIFHSFPALLPGGFVGVDIFFVISGYLISGIIFGEVEAGAFNFINFYTRRIKRIFPSLILVVLTCFIFAWFVMFSDELKKLGQHMLRASIFMSNFILWHESGYFDAVAETKPLLHLWSLSIEEQFYLFWPLLVYIFLSKKLNRGYYISFLIFLSFSWNIYQLERNSAHDFYSPLTRFWELLCGSLLAHFHVVNNLIFLFREKKFKFSSDNMSILGAALLVLSTVIVDSNSFPGYWAMLPVAGTVLLILAGPDGLINRTFLTNRVIVCIGLISYPLYLWHWPLLSFSRVVVGSTPSVFLRCVTIIMSFVMAWVTFVVVEKKFRFSPHLRSHTIFLVIAMFCMGLLGFLTNKFEGFQSRSIMSPSNVLYSGDIGHDAFHAYFQQNFLPCADKTVQLNAGQWKGMSRCFQSKSSPNVDLVLLGDSHAEQLFIGVAENLPNLNVAFYVKGALPTLDNSEFSDIFESILNSESVLNVIVTANWDAKLKDPIALNQLMASLDKTVKVLINNGKNVYLMPDLPQYEFDPQRCKFKRPFSSGQQCDQDLSQYKLKLDMYMPILTRVAEANPQLKFIKIEDILCSNERCSMVRNVDILYRDNNHLNIPGSKFVGGYIVDKYFR